MIRTTAFILFLFIFSFLNNDAHDNYPVGAKSSAMGNVSVMMDDVWSAHNNQGATAFYDEFAIGIHHETRYLVYDMGYQASVLTVPFKYGVMGLNFTLFGDKNFNDKKFGLSYSKKLFERLALGVQIDVINSYIQEYGKENNICAEIGLFAEPIDNFTIGAHVFNPFQSNYEYLPTSLYGDINISTVYKLGMGYHFEEKLRLAVEAEKDLYNKPVYRAGINYHALYGLYVRIGGALNPNMYTFGLGYVYKRMFADFAFMSNAYLGFTPHFSLCYEIH